MSDRYHRRSAALGAALLTLAAAVTCPSPGAGGGPAAKRAVLVDRLSSSAALTAFALKGRADSGETFSITFPAGGRLAVRVDKVPAEKPVHIQILHRFGHLDAAGKPTASESDVALIAFELRNTDRMEHRVGARVIVDTLIDNYDRHPFLVPNALGRVTTSADFRAATSGMPAYVRGVSLGNPVRDAYFWLRHAPAGEPPDRCLLTSLHHPGPKEWEVPVRTMTDSCMVLYWDDKDLGPGESRRIGFACALRRPPTNEPRAGGPGPK